MNLKWVSPSGTEITFSRTATDYRLTKNYSGLSTTPVIHQTQTAPFQDGSTLIDSLLLPREISFEIMILGADLTTVQTLTRALISAFNPKRGAGYLIYTNEAGEEYWITAIGNRTPTLSQTDRGLTFQRAFIDLVAHDPYWYAGTKEPVRLAGAATAFFPLTFPFTLGRNSDTATMTNDGDVPAPVTITLSGTMVNPVITNQTTGESITVNISLGSAERVVITTEFGNKMATFYRSDGSSEIGLSYISSTSTFWSLALGENTITLTTTSIGSDSYVSIESRDRYVGVA